MKLLQLRSAAALLVVAGLVASTQAYGFVRTTTCSSICHQVCPSDGVCEDGGDGALREACTLGGDCADCGLRADPAPDAVTSCWTEDGYTEPVPIAWLIDGVEYVVDSAGYTPISDLSAILQTVDSSFETWNSATGSYVRATHGGSADVGANNVDMVNVITFVEDNWAYAPAALAIASVTYSPCGEIVDADIELNADDWSFRILGTGPVLATSHDLQNTLTHEIGHFLGFDHCDNDAAVGAADCSEATMRVQTEAGDITMRDLSADDIAAIAHVYPIGGSPPGTSSCQTERRRRRGCASAEPRVPAWWVGLLGFLGMRRTRGRR
jgi:hypothetical protein